MTYASTVESIGAPLSETENRLNRKMAREDEKDTYLSLQTRRWRRGLRA